MNDSTITSITPYIETEVKRRYVARAFSWACVSLIFILAPLATLSWLDSLIVLSTPWRWLSLAATVCALIGAVLAYARYCRRPSSGDAARILDRASSLQNGYVVTTSHEMKSKMPASEEEDELLKRLHHAADRLAATSKPAHPWPGLLTVILAVISLIAFVSISIRENGMAVRRALQPWLAMPYTQVELGAPKISPAQREPFAIEGKISGRIPKQAQISWTEGHSATVSVMPDGSFSHQLALGLRRDSTFVAAAHDGESEPLVIELREVPKVESYTFSIKPPGYTGWPESFQTRPGFVILRASTVQILLKTDLPAKSIRFVPDNNQGEIKFGSSSEDGKSWYVNLGKLTRTFSYQIYITDDKGEYPAESDLQMIVVRPDAPPTFESFTHNGDMLASERQPEAFTLNYRAADDIGINNTEVTCTSLNGKIIPATIRKIEGNPLTHADSWDIPLKALRDAGVQPMDMFLVTVTVRDGNDVDGPGSISEPIFLEMPFPQSDGKDDDKKDDGKPPGGSEGTPPININPLALQKDIHRHIVRSALKLKAPDPKEIAKLQDAVAEHLEAMVNSNESEAIGEEYVGHLKKALENARLSSNALNSKNTETPRSRIVSGFSDRRIQFDIKEVVVQPNNPVEYSSVVLKSLIEAAKIEAAKEDSPPPAPPEGEMPQPPGPPQVQYSLIKPPKNASKQDDKKNEEDLINDLINEMNDVLDDQRKLNDGAKDLVNDAKEPKDGEPKDGEPKDGEPKDGEPKDGAPKDGAPKDGAPKDGAPKDGAPKDGAPKDGAPKDGAPKDGAPNGGPSNSGDSLTQGPRIDGSENHGEPHDGASGEEQPDGKEPKNSKRGEDRQLTAAELAEELATIQGRIAKNVNEIQEGVEGIKSSDRQDGAKKVIDALMDAKNHQQQAAEALRSMNLDKAQALGANAENSLNVANTLTKSLLDKQITRGIEAQAPAAGYETIIQDYSRRISYDQ